MSERKSKFGFTGRDPNPWSPMYPEIAVETGYDPAPAIQGEPPDRTTFGKGFIAAPADSHLHSFALQDYRDVRRKPFASVALDRTSQIVVRFRPPPNKPEQGLSEYAYYFADHDEANKYMKKLEGHPDPGEIVWEMRRAGIPYRKLAG
jgi:hypothetical protein